MNEKKPVETIIDHENQDSSKVFPINDLPYEVLIQIFANLDMIQLSSIRLVCKTWNYAISDKSIWSKSFSQKFGTPSKFPSVTNSPMWMQEYFGRLKVYKKWSRAQGIHHSYKLINNEYRNIDFALADFERNQVLGRLLTFSKRFGTVTTCNLVDGKNQGYIPADLYNKISSFKINWNYLLMGLYNGNLLLKNLTTSGSTSSSVVKFETRQSSTNTDMDSIIATDMRSHSSMDKMARTADIITGSLKGKLQLWNTNGVLLHELRFEEAILNIKSDFKKFIIMNTATTLYIIDFQDYSVLQKLPLDFIITLPEIFENNYNYFGTRSYEDLNHLDVDFGDYNIIICYMSIIKVFHFRDISHVYTRQLELEDGVYITRSQMQTVRPRKVEILGTRDTNVAGKDGLLYGNVLSDSSVIIWNVRQHGKIVPQCQIYPKFGKYSPQIPANNWPIGNITAIALNSSIVAIGGYNGFTNIHNVSTGEFIKEASVKYPRKYTHMYSDLVPINSIQLNEDQAQTNGVIICGDTIQYFQFGEKDKLSGEGQSKSKRRLMNKVRLKNSILDELDDYEHEMLNRQQQQVLFDKYNGDQFDDEEEELSMAIAMSRSSLSNTDSDLQLAIELSQQESSSNVVQASQPHDNSLSDMDEDEQLRRALELSLVEH